MTTDSSRNQALAAMATLRGYPFIERLGLWQERLARNDDEIKALQRAQPPATGPYRPGTCTLTEAITPLGEAFGGVADALARGEVSPPRRLHEAIRRARERSDLNAFITLADDPGAPGAGPAGEQRGPLAGVALGIKDMVAVSGFALTGGSLALGCDIAREDAVCVARLREAGALIVGTTNLHELAYGITSENPHFGNVANPIAPGRIAGGSSGGSAAAVAAGIVDGAIGTDTAGSVRIPAACCGVVGFKPSYGLIPLDGVVPLGWSLDHLGTFTHNVTDAAALTAVLAGTGFSETDDNTAAERPLRIVRPTNHFFDHLQPFIREEMERVIGKLKSAGHDVVERRLDLLECAAGTQFVTLATEATEYHYDLLLNRPQALGEDVRVRLEVGQFLSAIDYQKAQRIRQAMSLSWLRTIQDADVILTPTLIAEPPPHSTPEVQVGDLSLPTHTAMTRCTMPFNLTGMPAITLPVTNASRGWPVAIQLAAAHGRDAFLLDAASRVEAVLEDS